MLEHVFLWFASTFYYSLPNWIRQREANNNLFVADCPMAVACGREPLFSRREASPLPQRWRLPPEMRFFFFIPLRRHHAHLFGRDVTHPMLKHISFCFFFSKKSLVLFFWSKEEVVVLFRLLLLLTVNEASLVFGLEWPISCIWALGLSFCSTMKGERLQVAASCREERKKLWLTYRLPPAILAPITYTGLDDILN